MSLDIRGEIPRITPLRDETRERLRNIGTATLANVLLRHGLRNCYLLGLTPINNAHARMVGPAYTLRFIPAREDIDSMVTYQSDANLHRRAIEECPPGAVLVIAAGGDTTAASAGDIMVARLARRGVAGVITDGGYRDTPSIRRVGLPAFQRQAAPPATPIMLHPADLNVAVGCAGVAIYPGDIIVSDEEGVVAIPSGLADVVAEEGCAAMQYEEFVELQIAQGRTIFGLFPATDQSRVEYEAWVAAGRPT